MFEERNKDYERRGESYDRPSYSNYGRHGHQESDNERQSGRASGQYGSNYAKYSEGENDYQSGGRHGHSTQGVYNDENDGYGNSGTTNEVEQGGSGARQSKLGAQQVAHGSSANQGTAQEYYNAPQDANNRSDGQQNYNRPDPNYQAAGYSYQESTQHESNKGMSLGKKVMLGAGVAAGSYLLAKKIKSYKEKQNYQEALPPLPTQQQQPPPQQQQYQERPPQSPRPPEQHQQQNYQYQQRPPNDYTPHSYPGGNM